MTPDVNQTQIERCLLQVVGEEHLDLREAITERAEVLELRSGQILFEQGDEGDGMYLVVRGRVRASTRDVDGSLVPVIEVGRNESIGEIALFTNHTRTATVMALRDSLLLKLSSEDFEQLSQEWPGFSLGISKRVVDRLSRSMLGLPPYTHKATILTLVATHNGVDIDSFSDALNTALQKHGPVLVLNARNFRSHLERAGIAERYGDYSHNNIAAWMDELENEYRFVICVGTTASTQWTRRCVRIADKVILIGDDDTSEAAHALNQQTFQKARVDVEFIRLHSGSSKNATNTDALLLNRQTTRHHHICLTQPEDLDRLGRFLAGKAVGIVLAGGGARGFAHIGVIKALREVGIPIDYVGGTSVGAIIGGLLAMGMSDEEIRDNVYRAFVEEKPLSDYTVPVVAMLKGNKLDSMLQRYFPLDCIEDLWLNFFCVSANLTTNETVVHEAGSLWRSIRASIALPGVLPPVIKNGELLIDGGLVNNLPVDVMASKGVGKIIAVDLQGGDRQFSVNEERMPPMTERLRKRWMPDDDDDSRDGAPGIIDIILRASLISSSQHSARNQTGADLYLNPPMDKIGLLEFKAFEQIVTAGYVHAHEELAKRDGKLFS